MYCDMESIELIIACLWWVIVDIVDYIGWNGYCLEGM